MIARLRQILAQRRLARMIEANRKAPATEQWRQRRAAAMKGHALRRQRMEAQG